MFETLLEKQIELEQINDAIIAKQKAYITQLELHIEELHAVIKKHLIKEPEL